MKSVLLCTPGRCGTHWVAYVLKRALGLHQLPGCTYEDSEWQARELAPGWLYLTHDPIQAWEPAWNALDIVVVVRNPMDIVVSAAFYRTHRQYTAEEREAQSRFWGQEVDNATSFDELFDRLKVEGHNPRWWEGYMQNGARVPHYTVRYEDLHRHPLYTFYNLFLSMGYPIDVTTVEYYIRMQREKAFGNRARGEPDTSSFYRLGRIDEGLVYFTPKDATQFREDHALEMKLFGYL